MVFSSVNPDPRTYRLWRRFSLPTSHGIKDAVAVKKETADQLNSAYTFLLEHIVLLVWGITVLVAILILVRRFSKINHADNTAFSTEVWNNKSSPYDVLKITFKGLTKSGHSRWLVVLWVAVAVAFLIVRYAVPIIFARYIILDRAAPVNVDSIYIPTIPDINNDDAHKTLIFYSDEVPAALRSVGLIDNVKVDATANTSITIGEPQVLQNLGGGEVIMSIGYKYTVTGLDMGLQKYPDLMLSVEGSCRTEYGWLISQNVDSAGILNETYSAFGDTISVSTLDGAEPRATFIVNPQTEVIDPPGNTTWAVIPSTANRTSYWSGTDPFYLTSNQTAIDINDYAYVKVKPGRPALSCWQNDVWSWHGYSSNINDITNDAVFPGMNLPKVFGQIFGDLLGEPLVAHLGRQLGPQALESATATLGTIFNASAASTHADLTHLVFGAYIATVNTLADTTFPSPDTSLPNSIIDATTGAAYVGTGDFVVWSSDVATLSVKALIIIPVLTLGLWIMFLVLMFAKVPGKEVSKLTLKVDKKLGKEGGAGEADLEAQKIKSADEEKKLGEKITKVWETILPVPNTNGN